MKKHYVALALVVWGACGYLNYGLTLGHFTHRFPWERNRSVAVTMALGGPFALPAVLDDPNHWLTKPLTTEERWEAFHQRWPNLSREDFERDCN